MRTIKYSTDRDRSKKFLTMIRPLALLYLFLVFTTYSIGNTNAFIADSKNTPVEFKAQWEEELKKSDEHFDVVETKESSSLNPPLESRTLEEKENNVKAAPIENAEDTTKDKLQENNTSGLINNPSSQQEENKTKEQLNKENSNGKKEGEEKFKQDFDSEKEGESVDLME